MSPDLSGAGQILPVPEGCKIHPRPPVMRGGGLV
jgi:hypothetical protein